MKILSGAYRADPGGEILISGRLATIASPGNSLALGIAIIYQELSLAPNMTAAENIFLGRERQPGGRFSRKNMERAATSILESLGVRFPASTVVSQLSMGERQLVEIARALSAKAKVLIMDEPTASLSARETERLFDVIGRLRSQGLAIIYISHRMDEVYALADRVSVLRDGVHVGAYRSLSTVGRSADPHDGRARRNKLLQKNTSTAASARSCRWRSGRRLLHTGISFDLREGEVLGLAGLVGAGRTELARLIYGADPRSEGSMALEGRPFSPGEPMEAIEAGLAYLTEDRKGLGLFLDMSVAENVNLGVLRTTRGSAFSIRAPFAHAPKGNAIARHSLPRRECERRYAVRRKPAEGAAVAPAGNTAEGADPGRANARRRCRRQVGNLPHHRRSRAARRRDPGHSAPNCRRSSASPTASW